MVPTKDPSLVSTSVWCAADFEPGVSDTSIHEWMPMFNTSQIWFKAVVETIGLHLRMQCCCPIIFIFLVLLTVDNCAILAKATSLFSLALALVLWQFCWQLLFTKDGKCHGCDTINQSRFCIGGWKCVRIWQSASRCADKEKKPHTIEWRSKKLRHLQIARCI